MIEFPRLEQGVFVQRVNRFVAKIRDCTNREVLVHVPNSGRMTELFQEGANIAWHRILSPERKTAGKLYLVEFAGSWVCIDSNVPNQLVFGGWQDKLLEPLDPFPNIIREFSFGRSRFDLADPDHKLLGECKSVTLVEDGVARFPDAPTKRGAKHLSELIAAKALGWLGMVFFIIQRSDAITFTANSKTDPAFAGLLEDAYRAGIGVFAYDCEVSLSGIAIRRQIELMVENS